MYILVLHKYAENFFYMCLDIAKTFLLKLLDDTLLTSLFCQYGNLGFGCKTPSERLLSI